MTLECSPSTQPHLTGRGDAGESGLWFGSFHVCWSFYTTRWSGRACSGGGWGSSQSQQGPWSSLGRDPRSLTQPQNTDQAQTRLNGIEGALRGVWSRWNGGEVAGLVDVGIGAGVPPAAHSPLPKTIWTGRVSLGGPERSRCQGTRTNRRTAECVFKSNSGGGLCPHVTPCVLLPPPQAAIGVSGIRSTLNDNLSQ